MKFEQALRAMRRGEAVRRRGLIDALEMREGKVYCNGQLDVTPWCMDAILADDWVIIRKKKKLQPVPIRNVFTDPRVGDVVQLTDCSPDTIHYVDADMVALWDGVDAYAMSREAWAGGTWEVISRQP